MLISYNFFSRLSNLLEDFFFKRVKAQKPSKVIDLSTVDDNNWVARLIFFVNRNFWDFSYDLHSIYDLPEDYMFPI